jgi:ATP-binding cassette subfamily F protein uup
MTFKDRHALDTLPARIAALTEEVARLGVRLADADLYTRDPAGFAATTRALAAARDAVAQAEEQWLALEMLREEIEG